MSIGEKSLIDLPELYKNPTVVSYPGPRPFVKRRQSAARGFEDDGGEAR